MNPDLDAKGALASVIRGYLDKHASYLFIKKSLEILYASANNKESFITACTQISKRITMFIDKNLAQRVYEGLIAEIERLAVPQGTRRRYRRVNFDTVAIYEKKVSITCGGKVYELDSLNLSEGGIFIKTKDPFPVGSEIAITLPLELGRYIHLTGVVVHKRGRFNETSTLSSGMGIEFENVSVGDAEGLRSYVKKIRIASICR